MSDLGYRNTSQASLNVSVNSLDHYIRDLTRLGDYSSDPQFLVNRAAADYYGVDTIIALDQKPEP
jgi:hypothetical protein